MFSAIPSQDDVRAFEAHLAAKGGWVFARVLRAELGVNNRHLRALAHAAKGRVLSGQQGYLPTSAATSEELQKCLHRQRAQARNTLRRIDHTERVWANS